MRAGVLCTWRGAFDRGQRRPSRSTIGGAAGVTAAGAVAVIIVVGTGLQIESGTTPQKTGKKDCKHPSAFIGMGQLGMAYPTARMGVVWR